ncbi:hypothetical protein ACE6H2_017216 [Prunus campanulata]
MGIDSLSIRAAMMSESLQKSQTITNSVVSILSSFDHCLSALETSMRPTHSGYEGMHEEDEEDGIAVDEEEEGDEGTIPVDTNVVEDRHEGTAHEGTKVAKDRHEGTAHEGTNVAEDRHEGTVPKGINVDEEGNEGTVPNGINGSLLEGEKGAVA